MRLNIMNENIIVFSMDSSGHLISTIRMADDDLELNIHTNQIHYLSIQAETNVVKDFCFSVHHQDHYTLKMIDDIELAYNKNTNSQSKLFFSKENNNNPEELIFQLEQPIGCAVFDSLLRYYDFSADVSPDFICVEHNSICGAQHGCVFTYININHMNSIDVYKATENEKSSLLQFNKLPNQNTITLTGSCLSNLEKFDVVISCSGAFFKVDIGHLIQIFNKQIYGSINSYRAKMMQRRLLPIVNILSRLKQVEKFLLMDNTAT